MRNSRRHLSSAILAFAAVAAFARGPVEPVDKNRDGLALRGYDPVAYFTQSKPVRGVPQFSFHWMNATWWFASQSDRDLFTAEPEKYAPQFGGYCAWAVGHNYTADGDPEAWKIVDGKLFVNYNKDVQKKWEPDAANWIAKAMQNWPSLHR